MKTQTAPESLGARLGRAVLAQTGHVLGTGARLGVRHPFNTLGLLVLAGGTLMGSVNALWLQHGRHPAPLFMQTAAIADAQSENAQSLVPAPVKLSAPTLVSDKVGAVTPAPHRPSAIPAIQPIPDPVASMPSVPKVGNHDVAALQTKLKAMGYFTAAVDGYYGPDTAKAIRAFETATGLEPNGALTPAIKQAVAAAPLHRQTASVPAPVVPATKTTPDMPGTAGAKAPADDPIGRIAQSVATRQSEAASPAPAPKTVIPAAKAQKTASVRAETSPQMVSMVQNGLARLGFYAGPVSGKFDETTARAIRAFETFNNYPMTGKIEPGLIDMLMAAGAYN